jgi:hypothetical protein
MRKLFIVLLTIMAILAIATPTVQGCNRVIVRQSDDLVKVFSAKNTKYIIKDALDLGGKKVKIGEGSTLVFRGGSMANGTVVGNNTRVKARNYEIFKRGYVRYRAYTETGANRNSPPKVIKERHNYLVIEGTWNNRKCGTNWTGLERNCKEDAMLAIQNYVTLHSAGSMVVYPNINVLGYESAILPGNHVIDFNNSTISYPDNLAIWEDNSIALPKGSIPCPVESGYGLITTKTKTTIKNLNIDGKSAFRQDEPVRLGVSCMVAVSGAQNVTFENVVITNVLGPAITAQAGAKDILYKNCKFRNIGEHVIYSHQYKGFCYFENCTFDTWDSKRVSEYRDGLDYLYKHRPPYEKGEISIEELYSFDLSFSKCTFDNPKRVTKQGRTLGGFFTGTFPVVIEVVDCKFNGAYPVINPGNGCPISEEVGKPYRLIVRGSDGAPFIYSTKSNCNIITEFYGCVNIPFRTVYAKRYERCKLFLDVNESNMENVTPFFKKEFSEPLVIKECEFTDNGKRVNINHPVFHRPVLFENCTFYSSIRRETLSSVLSVKSDIIKNVTFKSCVIDLFNFQLVECDYSKKLISVVDCDIKAINK